MAIATLLGTPEEEGPDRVRVTLVAGAPNATGSGGTTNTGTISWTTTVVTLPAEDAQRPTYQAGEAHVGRPVRGLD